MPMQPNTYTHSLAFHLYLSFPSDVLVFYSHSTTRQSSIFIRIQYTECVFSDAGMSVSDIIQGQYHKYRKLKYLEYFSLLDQEKRASNRKNVTFSHTFIVSYMVLGIHIIWMHLNGLPHKAIFQCTLFLLIYHPRSLSLSRSFSLFCFCCFFFICQHCLICYVVKFVRSLYPLLRQHTFSGYFKLMCGRLKDARDQIYPIPFIPRRVRFFSLLIIDRFLRKIQRINFTLNNIAQQILKTTMNLSFSFSLATETWQKYDPFYNLWKIPSIRNGSNRKSIFLKVNSVLMATTFSSS